MNALTPHLRSHDETIITTYLEHHLPFFIEGSPGIGKSLAARYLGEKVYHRQQCRNQAHHDENVACKPLKIDITEDTEVRHLLGEVDFVRYFLDARSGEGAPQIKDYFRDGPLVTAMKAGRLLIVEELDRAGRETLFPVLFDAIEQKRTYVPDLGEEIKAQPAFNLVITVNRFTDVGTVRLPEALLRRLRRVGLYDPARDGYALPPDVNPEESTPDRQERRQFAFEFERSVVFNNLAYETGTSPQYVKETLETALRRQLGDPIVQQIEALLNLIYALRGDLRMSQGDLAGEHITPAEASRFICDVILCDRDSILSRDPAIRRAVLHKHIGALGKNELHAQAIADALDRRYIDKKAPFEPVND